MSRGIPLRAAALVLCLSTALTYASAQASTPHLRHSTAPFVGQVLTLEVEGAVPLSTIELYFSPEAGSFATPYGLLELRRNTLQLLASGTTSSSGTWSFDLPIPLQQSLAETGAHFQVLVDDASAPAGKIFSDSVHARFMGSRVYAGFRAGDPGYGSRRIGMYIVSAVTNEVVARVDYGLSDGWGAYRHEGKPVFDAAFSRGAVMSTEHELLFFDPFFGGVQSRIAFASPCSRTLFTDSARRTVHVLELAGGSSPARVHAIDLASGAETAHLDLPNSTEAIWCGGRAGSEVFIAEHEPGGRTAIRWVGLDPLVDRGSAPVGMPGSGSFTAWDGDRYVPLPMLYAAGQVFVSTVESGGQSLDGNLTRCRATSSGIATRVSRVGDPLLNDFLLALASLPAANCILGGVVVPPLGGGLLQLPLSPIGPPTWVPWPPTGSNLTVHEIEPDGQVAWIIGEWEWQHNDILYRLDLETMTWTVTPYSWFFGPKDAEVVRDAWNHEVWVSNVGYGPPVNIDPEILVVDELHGTSRHIALDHTAEVLHAVPLP